MELPRDKCRNIADRIESGSLFLTKPARRENEKKRKRTETNSNFRFSKLDCETFSPSISSFLFFLYFLLQSASIQYIFRREGVHWQNTLSVISPFLFYLLLFVVRLRKKLRQAHPTLLLRKENASRFGAGMIAFKFIFYACNIYLIYLSREKRVPSSTSGSAR